MLGQDWEGAAQPETLTSGGGLSSEGRGRSQIECCCRMERRGAAALLEASNFGGHQIRRNSFLGSLVSTCS